MKRGITVDLLDNEEAALQLADELVTCKLPEDNEHLKKIVKEVQVHKHTKSCQKGSSSCRFFFPRLPSDRTLISNPLSEEELGKEEYDKKRNDAKDILDRVKKQ